MSVANAPVTIPNGADISPVYHGKCYVFTKNNPDTVLDLANYGVYLNSLWPVKYAIWSLERGASGTPHIQGYIQWEAKHKWQAVRNKMRGAWVAPAKGNPQHNVDYISHTGAHIAKPGLIQGPWTYGDMVVMGQRTDIEGLVEDIKSGSSVKQLAVNHTATMLKYFGNAQKLVGVLGAKKRDWMTELYIYTGVAGSGKSHSAFEEAKQYLADNNIDEVPYYLMVPAKGEPVWWQDYNGESVVIIDDFYGTIGLDYFKRLIDKYPMKINMKNGSAEFLARRVYITSNQGWRSWWGTDLLTNAQNEDAITRRITVDKHFGERYAAVPVAPPSPHPTLVRQNAIVNANYIFDDNDLEVQEFVPPTRAQSPELAQPREEMSPLGQFYYDRDFNLDL